MNIIVCLGFALGALSAAAKVIYSKPRQSVTLECGVKSYGNQLAWYHKGQLIITIDGKSGLSRNGLSAIRLRSRMIQDKNLKITEVRKEDAGAFTCEADRLRHEHTLLVVSVSASPSGELQPGSSALLQCDVEGPNADSPVQWVSPDGRPLTGSTVTLNPVTFSDAGTWTCAFSYGGETSRENLEVIVQDPAPTPPPVRGPKVNNGTSCHSCNTDPDAAAGGQLGWWLWAAVGAGCVVVVLLMTLIIVLCRKIRRRKRKLQKMRNGRQSSRPMKYCQCKCRAAAEKPQRGRQKGKPPTLALEPLLME